MIVRTKNSVYELDLELMRCRRVSGKESPTKYTGVDGEWRDFTSVQVTGPGSRMLITWGPKEGSALMRSTWTSPVDTIEYTPDELARLADTLVESSLKDLEPEER